MLAPELHMRVDFTYAERIIGVSELYLKGCLDLSLII